MAKTIVRVCGKNYSGLQFTALSRGPIPGHSPVQGSRYRRGLGRQALRIMRECKLATAIAVRPLTQQRMSLEVFIKVTHS